jgi:hypothetical protein
MRKWFSTVIIVTMCVGLLWGRWLGHSEMKRWQDGYYAQRVKDAWVEGWKAAPTDCPPVVQAPATKSNKGSKLSDDLANKLRKIAYLKGYSDATDYCISSIKKRFGGSAQSRPDARVKLAPCPSGIYTLTNDWTIIQCEGEP